MFKCEDEGRGTLGRKDSGIGDLTRCLASLETAGLACDPQDVVRGELVTGSVHISCYIPTSVSECHCHLQTKFSQITISDTERCRQLFEVCFVGV